MSTEAFVFDREAFLNKAVADHEAQFAVEAAENRALLQIINNRRNAIKSTGPRTPEGKAASSKNRLAHGLCSSSLLIRGESPEEFEALHTEIVGAYRPATPEEKILTDQLAEAQWRLNRARRVEAKTFSMLADDTFTYLKEENGEEDPANYDSDQLVAISFASVPNETIFRNLYRYVAAIEKSHQRCLKNLQYAQEKRRTLPPPPPVQPEEVKVATANSPLPEVGFEPQFVPTGPGSAPAYTDRC